jgi:hypothetical protein
VTHIETIRLPRFFGNERFVPDRPNANRNLSFSLGEIDGADGAQEPHPVLVADHQRCSDGAFESRQPAADGRVLHAERAGCARERASPCHCQEIAQIVPIKDVDLGHGL